MCFAHAHNAHGYFEIHALNSISFHHTHTHMQPWIGNSNSTIIIATVADDVAATTASATATAIANMYRHFRHIVHI